MCTDGRSYLVTYLLVIQYVHRQQVAVGYLPSSDPVCAQTAGRIWSHVTVLLVESI